jgi:hypothetical protein
MHILLILCYNGSLDIWTVVSFTATKFKPLVFYMSRFTLSCAAGSSQSVMLRPTVGWPVYLGIKHPSGAYDQTFITVRQLRICWCWVVPLTRGQVCRLQLLLVLSSAVILGSESRPYYTVSYSRLPFSSLPTTRRATVAIFDPASTRDSQSQSQSYVTTDARLASLSWNKASIWGLRADLYYCQTIAGLMMWGTLSQSELVDSLCKLGADRIENAASNSCSIVA